MAFVNTSTLDHIVHLTPPGSVEEVSRQFQDLGFTVVAGGTHADGLTANALVVFEDGVYLELISFTHPASHYPLGSAERERRDRHRWAKNEPGWIDYAFLGNGSMKDSVSQVINERSQQDDSGVEYAPEQPGGRRRMDGKILEWLISAPSSDTQGVLPFFCGDVTARSLRVPSEPATNTDHPSTAVGIGHVKILAPPHLFEAISKKITSVIGKQAKVHHTSEATWDLDAVYPGAFLPQLILTVPRTADDLSSFKDDEIGIYEVAFRVKRSVERAPLKTPYGRIVWVTV